MNSAPADRPPGRSRRWLLAGAGLVVAAGAAGGVALGSSSGTPRPAALTARVPAELIAAERAEVALLAGLDRDLRTAPAAQRAVLRAVRADHAAHLRAVRSAIARAAYPAPAPVVRRTPGPAGTPGARESRAAQAAAARALRLTGEPAVLLASISACEATHAELLS